MEYVYVDDTELKTPTKGSDMSAALRATIVGESGSRKKNAPSPTAVLGKSLVLDCTLPSSSVNDVQKDSASGDQKKLVLPQPFEHYVLDHEGPVRLVLQKDGTVSYEIGDNREADNSSWQARLKETSGPVILKGLQIAAGMSVVVGGSVGVVTTLARIEDGDVTPRDLFWSVSEAVSSAVAGVLTGSILGPLIAVKAITLKLAQPVLVIAAVRGLHGLWKRRFSIKQLLEHLQSSNFAHKLAALERVAARAASARFRDAFQKSGGLAMLLQLLHSPLDEATIQAILKAIASIAQNPDGQAMLATPAVVQRLHTLAEHPDTVISQRALEALGYLSSHPVAQQTIRS